MVIGQVPPPTQAPASRGFWSSVGGLLSSAKNKLGSATSKVTSGVSSLACRIIHRPAVHATRSIRKKILPLPGTYKELIQARYTELRQLSGSSITPETVRYLSIFAYDFLKHNFAEAENMDESVRIGMINELMPDKTSGKGAHGIIGASTTEAIVSNEAIIKEIIESHILKAFINIYRHIETKQQENPLWTLDFAKDVCDTYTTFMKTADGPQPQIKDPLDAQFSSVVSTALIRIAFPRGETDINLPFTGGHKVAKALYAMVEKTMLPRVFNFVFVNGTTDFCRDTMLYNIFAIIAKTLNTPSLFLPQQEGAEEPAPAAPPPPPYPNEDRFSESLATFVITFLEKVNPSLFSRVGTFISKETIQCKIKRTIAAQVPQLVTTINNINLIPHIEQALQLMIPVLNDGIWKKNQQGDWVFNEAPSVFFTKRREELAVENMLDRRRPELQQEIQTIIDRIPEHFEQLYDIIGDSILPLPSLERVNQIFNEGDVHEQIKLGIKILIQQLIVMIVRLLVFAFGGKAVLKETLQNFVAKANARPLGNFFTPLEMLIAQKGPEFTPRAP